MVPRITNTLSLSSSYISEKTAITSTNAPHGSKTFSPVKESYRMTLEVFPITGRAIMENKDDILRRGRLSGGKSEDINAFTSSLQADRWIFPADVMVDQAHTAMLAKQGIIKKADAASILMALQKIGS